MRRWKTLRSTGASTSSIRLSVGLITPSAPREPFHGTMTITLGSSLLPVMSVAPRFSTPPAPATALPLFPLPGWPGWADGEWPEDERGARCAECWTPADWPAAGWLAAARLVAASAVAASLVAG